jgi:hypothetical protein
MGISTLCGKARSASRLNVFAISGAGHGSIEARPAAESMRRDLAIAVVKYAIFRIESEIMSIAQTILG